MYLSYGAFLYYIALIIMLFNFQKLDYFSCVEKVWVVRVQLLSCITTYFFVVVFTGVKHYAMSYELALSLSLKVCRVNSKYESCQLFTEVESTESLIDSSVMRVNISINLSEIFQYKTNLAI